MNRVSAGALVLALCFTAKADDKPADAQKADRIKVAVAALQGEWELTARGKPAEPDIVCERITIKGDKLTFHDTFNGKQFPTECTFTVDPTTDPRQIDFRRSDEKGKPYLGIYELTDGKLRFHYRGPDSTRPKDFKDASAGSAVTVTYEFKLRKGK
jgi:uncharacterized protein (TIGR03067 family)